MGETISVLVIFLLHELSLVSYLKCILIGLKLLSVVDKAEVTKRIRNGMWWLRSN